MSAPFGTVTALVSGVMVLTPIAGQKFWYIQNKDASNNLELSGAAGSGFTGWTLGPLGTNDYIDSVGIPYQGAITLTGTATQAFHCGASTSKPTENL